jgi:hypothetical protein
LQPIPLWLEERVILCELGCDMSKPQPEIDERLAAWLASQRVFFVATAPLSASGHINCSPKGGESFRVLAPHEVAYLDYTGSGAETIAHVRENGRIVLMFCAFEGPPQIARLHGRGELLFPGHAEFTQLAGLFPQHPGIRAVVRVKVDRISTSCGYGVPFFEFKGPRDTLERWAANQGPEGLVEYRRKKNRASIDSLPAVE